MQTRKADSPFSKFIKCECGADILYVSDLGAMRKSIDAHAETHRELAYDCSKTEAENEGMAEVEVERIKGNLIAEAMKVASQPKS